MNFTGHDTPFHCCVNTRYNKNPASAENQRMCSVSGPELVFQ